MYKNLSAKWSCKFEMDLLSRQRCCQNLKCTYHAKCQFFFSKHVGSMNAYKIDGIHDIHLLLSLRSSNIAYSHCHSKSCMYLIPCHQVTIIFSRLIGRLFARLCRILYLLGLSLFFAVYLIWHATAHTSFAHGHTYFAASKFQMF